MACSTWHGRRCCPFGASRQSDGVSEGDLHDLACRKVGTCVRHERIWPAWALAPSNAAGRAGVEPAEIRLGIGALVERQEWQSQKEGFSPILFEVSLSVWHGAFLVARPEEDTGV